jgi:hypothetical protein
VSHRMRCEGPRCWQRESGRKCGRDKCSRGCRKQMQGRACCPLRGWHGPGLRPQPSSLAAKCMNSNAFATRQFRKGPNGRLRQYRLHVSIESTAPKCCGIVPQTNAVVFAWMLASNCWTRAACLLCCSGRCAGVSLVRHRRFLWD